MISSGRMISLRGCIMRTSSEKPLADWIVFSCSNCSLKITVKQPNGIYTLPQKCQICGGRKFEPRLDSASTRSLAFQVIRIQEHLGDEQDDRGRMPRTVDIELMDDLVGTCMAGEDVTVTGIIKIRGIDDGVTKGNASTDASLYMEAVSIVSNKDKSQNKNTAGIELKEGDYAAIQAIESEPNLFRLLVQSLCPGIFGYEMIKAGLILSLFGGSANFQLIRDDIHILIVGDPGLGKSQMLQACARVAPKGVYICGNSSTSSGLTVSLSRESGSSDFVLEPGALVLADKGCCCIDEFDKMATQHEALLEAMEQQRVSLAKSGMTCSIPARTTVLAAANPAGGRYNKARRKNENLKISQQLLSRFDLVFILLDQPDQEFDTLLSEHVMALYAGTKIHDEDARSVASCSTIQSQGMGDSLSARLSVARKEVLDLIPHPLVRKYISYARQYVRPKISDAAVKVLQTYYLQLREEQKMTDNIYVSGRKLEAMIRLTEARAKLELREEATERDALDVVEIVGYTMTDPDVSTDVIIGKDLSGSRLGKLSSNKVKTYMKLLKDTASIRGTTMFSTSDLKDVAQRGNLAIDDFYSFIATLNDRCFLLNKGSGMYQLV